MDHFNKSPFDEVSKPEDGPEPKLVIVQTIPARNGNILYGAGTYQGSEADNAQCHKLGFPCLSLDGVARIPDAVEYLCESLKPPLGPAGLHDVFGPVSPWVHQRWM